MIEDILASVGDLFGGDTTLMIAIGIALCGSAIAFLVVRVQSVRGAIERRVAGAGEEGASQIGRNAKESSRLTARVGGALEKLAGAAGQTDRAQTRVLRARMIQAGYLDSQALVWFFGARVIAAFLFAGAVAFGAVMFDPETSWLAMIAFALLGVMIGFVAPTVALDKRINRLKSEHASGFPDFMDLMVVCAQAGLSMEASINRIAGEITQAYPSMARNLDMTAREIRSGKPLAKAIESLAGRLGIPEASSFSTLLQQSEELGSSLTQSLRTYSDDMRNKRLMKAEEKAYSLPAKLVVPLTLFVFPVLLVVLLLPVVISVSSANL